MPPSNVRTIRNNKDCLRAAHVAVKRSIDNTSDLNEWEKERRMDQAEACRRRLLSVLHENPQEMNRILGRPEILAQTLDFIDQLTAASVNYSNAKPSIKEGVVSFSGKTLPINSQ